MNRIVSVASLFFMIVSLFFLMICATCLFIDTGYAPLRVMTVALVGCGFGVLSISTRMLEV